MKRSYRILPVYSGDCSGVASALYELGGMVVIHDPSGCNSTYNTHDETRWYRRPSLIFISGLKESDAVMGNDRKFVEDVTAAARQLKPAFIALTNSPIPYINGTDFKALARMIEEAMGIPSFYVKANGMHDYTYGASLAFGAYAKHVLAEGAGAGAQSCRQNGDGPEQEARSRAAVSGDGAGFSGGHAASDENRAPRPRLNLLGATPLDFWDMDCIDEIRRTLKQMGWEIGCCYAMNHEETAGGAGASVENGVPDFSMQRGNDDDPAGAHVNLVLSGTGLAMARELKKAFGTPYVAGVPVGAYAQVLDRQLRKAAGLPYGDPEETSYAPASAGAGSAAGGSNYAVGESIVMGSIAEAIRLEYGTEFSVLCPVETGRDSEARPAGAEVQIIPVTGEEEIEAFLKDSDRVMGDPLYRHVCGPQTALTELPALSFSGRCFRKSKKNLMLLSEYYPSSQEVSE